MKKTKTSFGINRVTLPRAISKMGYASRAEALRLIERGAVTVNGEVERNPHRWVEMEKDAIGIEQKVLDGHKTFRYVLFHKPEGVITTSADERGRATVYDVAGAAVQGLRYAGRLDKDTSGLLLFSNDHAMLDRLTDPEAHVLKRYRVETLEPLGGAMMRRLMAGVEIRLDSGPYKARCADVEREEGNVLIITLDEGKNRQIRRMLEAVGAGVRALCRISFGPFELGTLPPGAVREVEPADARALVEQSLNPKET